MIAGENLANVVSALGSEHFGLELYRLLRCDFDVHHFIAFTATADGGPRCVLAVGNDADNTRLAGELCGEYSAGAYASCSVLEDVLTRHVGDNQISLVSPAQIKDKRFRERFYEEPRVKQEAVLSTRSGNRFLFASLFKGPAQRTFEADELQRLRSHSPLLLGLIGKQVQLQEAMWAPLDEQLRRFVGVLRADAARLSERESQVCGHIVCGYSSLAISLRLGITLNTVATHRKNAYRKLNISSQTELFASCLRATGRLI